MNGIIITAILLGVLLWPSSEYLLHRYLGHEIKSNNLFYKEHTAHHSKAFYFAPAIYKILACVLVLTLLTGISYLLLGQIWLTFSFVASFLSTYLFYEYTHYSIHAFAPRTRWGTRIRQHHFKHHYHSTRKNYGVTQFIFDRVFKTLDSTSQKAIIPLAFAPQWLIKNPELYSDSFELKIPAHSKPRSPTPEPSQV